MHSRYSRFAVVGLALVILESVQTLRSETLGTLGAVVALRRAWAVRDRRRRHCLTDPVGATPVSGSPNGRAPTPT